MAVDPDPAVLNFISSIASPWYSVIGARDPGWAKAWLLQHKDIVACVAGDKLTSAHGVDILDRCRHQQPSMLRVLVTTNIDGADTVRALLAGIAHRLVESPMCKENLGSAIDPMQLQASSTTVTSRRKLLAA
jgi:DNA-binding NtrC family response regulator